MSTSKNMPARFKSRTHLKHTIKHKDWNNRQRIIYRLEVAEKYRDKARSFCMLQSATKRKNSILKSYIIEAKIRLVEARRYRKSVVLPRLP